LPSEINLFTAIFFRNYVVIKGSLTSHNLDYIGQELKELYSIYEDALKTAKSEQLKSFRKSRELSFKHKYRLDIIVEPTVDLFVYQRQYKERTKSPHRPDGFDSVITINEEVMKYPAFQEAKRKANAFGLELVAFDFICLHGYLNGFYNSNNDVIYINSLQLGEKDMTIPTVVEQQRYVLQTSLHELTHHFEKRNIGLYSKLIEIAEGLNTISFSSFIEKNKQKVERGFYTPNDFLNEHLADFISEYVTRQSFWEYVIKKDKGVSYKLVYGFIYFYNRVKEYIMSLIKNDTHQRQTLLEIRLLEKQILKLHRENNNHLEEMIQ